MRDLDKNLSDNNIVDVYGIISSYECAVIYIYSNQVVRLAMNPGNICVSVIYNRSLVKPPQSD